VAPGLYRTRSGVETRFLQCLGNTHAIDFLGECRIHALDFGNPTTWFKQPVVEFDERVRLLRDLSSDVAGHLGDDRRTSTCGLRCDGSVARVPLWEPDPSLFSNLALWRRPQIHPALS